MQQKRCSFSCWKTENHNVQREVMNTALSKCMGEDNLLHYKWSIILIGSITGSFVLILLLCVQKLFIQNLWRIIWKKFNSYEHWHFQGCSYTAFENPRKENSAEYPPACFYHTATAAAAVSKDNGHNKPKMHDRKCQNWSKPKLEKGQL